MNGPDPVREWCTSARDAGRAGVVSDVLGDALSAALLAHLGGWDRAARPALVCAVSASRDVYDSTVEAVASGRSWVLSGTAIAAPSAADAAVLLVVARSRPVAGRERGLRVYAVPRDAQGVECVRRATIDPGGVTQVSLSTVAVDDRDAVGPPRDSSAAVISALDVATLVAVAEMAGAAKAALDEAVRWVSTREQFGAPLGAKQAVQHRAADMAIACAGVDALLEDALGQLDRGGPIALESSVAKLVASERLPVVTASAHQLHGGEGYYADRPMHRWHRRVTSLAYQLGDAAVHRRRLATLLYGR